VRPAAGQRAVLLLLSPCQTIVGISGAGGGPAVLGAAEQSTLVTLFGQEHSRTSAHNCAIQFAPRPGGAS
jgi:hypothetical protein